MARNASALLVAALLALACGSSEPEGRVLDERQHARLNKAMASLDDAPERVRAEVLKACDKWYHIDHPCVDEDVRIAQLECWLEEGIPAMKHAYARRIRPRARDLNILRMQNVCMEMRRWRKLKRGPDF